MKTYYTLICLLLGVYAAPAMSCKMIITRQTSLSESDDAVLLGSVQDYVKGTDGLNNWGVVVKITDQLPVQKLLPPLVEVFKYGMTSHCSSAASYSFDTIKAAFPKGSQVSVVAQRNAESQTGRVVLTISHDFGAMQINYNGASIESTFDYRRYFELLFSTARPITDPILKENHKFEYSKDLYRLAHAKTNLEKAIILSRLLYADPDPKFDFEQLLNSSIGNGEEGKAMRIEREKWLVKLRGK